MTSGPLDPYHDIGEQLRAVMRFVPSPVTVVTAGTEPPHGATIGSFTSLSLDPPLVSFNLTLPSRFLEVLEKDVPFNVHILRDDQASLGLHFALPGLTSEEMFANVAFARDDRGLPVLGDWLSLLSCRTYETIVGEQYALVLGRVERVAGPGEGAPMLYLNRAFRAVGGVREATPLDVSLP